MAIWLATTADMTAFGAIAAAAFGAGFAIAAVLFRRPSSAPENDSTTKTALGVRNSDDYDDGPHQELWEQLLDTCYHDFRVQALAGRDRDFFPTLHDPVFVDAEVRDDSPLLPGELAITDLDNPEQFLNAWRQRRVGFFDASADMPVDERQLYRRCLDDLIETLSTYVSEGNTHAFRLAVRTPDHHHVLLFTADLRKCLGVIPGARHLHDGHELLTPPRA